MVMAMHATRPRSPHQYASAIAAVPPAATGASGRRIPRAPPRARDSSHSAIAAAAARYTRKVAFTVNKVTMARPPSARPTPSAAGRFRPARAAAGAPAPGVPSSAGTAGPAGPSAGTSDLEELGFLVLEQFVHL